MDANCGNCRFLWRNAYGERTGFSEPAYRETLHCRRYPPSHDFDISNHAASQARMAPAVSADWCCGEWRPNWQGETVAAPLRNTRDDGGVL